MLFCHSLLANKTLFLPWLKVLAFCYLAIPTIHLRISKQEKPCYIRGAPFNPPGKKENKQKISQYFDGGCWNVKEKKNIHALNWLGQAGKLVQELPNVTWRKQYYMEKLHAEIKLISNLELIIVVCNIILVSLLYWSVKLMLSEDCKWEIKIQILNEIMVSD